MNIYEKLIQEILITEGINSAIKKYGNKIDPIVIR
jgi:hypothetical protein